MGDTTENNKAQPSPYEQTQQILNKIIERIKGLEFSEMLATPDENNDFADKEKIIVSDIKTERVEEEKAAEQEDIEAIEEGKKAERLQRDCEYIRGFCRLIIKYKKDNREAVDTAKKALEWLCKIERGEYSLWRELQDSLFILMVSLQYDNADKKVKEKKSTKSKNRPKQAEMNKRNMTVALFASNFISEHDRLPNVDEIIAITKFTRNQIYATDAYKDGKIAKNSAKVATEMIGRSVHETEQFTNTSETHSRVEKRCRSEQAVIDALISDQKKDYKSDYVLNQNTI